MITLLAGLLFLVYIIKNFDKVSEGKIALSFIAMIALIVLALLAPLEGYEEQKLTEEVELVKLQLEEPGEYYILENTETFFTYMHMTIAKSMDYLGVHTKK